MNRPQIQVRRSEARPGIGITIEPPHDIAATDIYLDDADVDKLLRQADWLAKRRKSSVDMIAVTVGYGLDGRSVWATDSPYLPPPISVTRPTVQFVFCLETADFETLIERIAELRG